MIDLKEYPYVTDIEIIKVEQEPMYDFTVDNYENMLIPLDKFGENNYSMFVFIILPYTKV